MSLPVKKRMQEQLFEHPLLHSSEFLLPVRQCKDEGRSPDAALINNELFVQGIDLQTSCAFACSFWHSFP